MESINRTIQSFDNSRVALESAMLECIEKGLDEFGSTFKFVVFFEIKKSEHISEKMLVSKPLTFSNVLDRMFGAGSVSIKKTIIQRLSERFGVSANEQDLVSMIHQIVARFEGTVNN